MDTMELMAKFADPETLKTLSMTQRLIAGLVTTVLGMGITFISLIILQFVIGLMAKFTGVKEQKPQIIGPALAPAAAAETQKTSKESEELVAAITVALAVQLDVAANNIVIRNIRKVEDYSPAWNRVGIAELMNNNS
jgi:sodium pump decarboxylase gamma subunit